MFSLAVPRSPRAPCCFETPPRSTNGWRTRPTPFRPIPRAAFAWPVQAAVLWQITQDVLPAIGRVGNNVKSSIFIGPAKDMQHIDGQYGTRAIPAALLRHRLLVAVQAEQDRQGEVSIGAKRQASDDDQYDPTMTPVEPIHLSAADQGIMMHADAEYLQRSLSQPRLPAIMSCWIL